MSAGGIATKTPPPQDPQPPTAHHVNHTREAIAATKDIRGPLDRPAAREPRTRPALSHMFLATNRLPELLALTEAFHALGSLTYLLTSDKVFIGKVKSQLPTHLTSLDQGSQRQLLLRASPLRAQIR